MRCARAVLAPGPPNIRSARVRSPWHRIVTEGWGDRKKINIQCHAVVSVVRRVSAAYRVVCGGPVEKRAWEHRIRPFAAASRVCDVGQTASRHCGAGRDGAGHTQTLKPQGASVGYAESITQKKCEMFR